MISDQEQADLESRIVWILGSPRTGSTWVLRLLSYPLVPTVKGLGFRRLHRTKRSTAIRVIPINEPYLPMHLTPLAVPPYRPGEQLSPADFIKTIARADDPHYFFSNEYADYWRPELRRLALGRFHLQVEPGASRFGVDRPLVAIKEPHGSHGAELLMSLFPGSRLIFLVRDGRDVVESMVAAHSPGGWLHGTGREFDFENPRQRMGFVTTQSRLWVQRMSAVQSAFDAHPPDRRLTIRYEDLVANTQPALRELEAWLGLSRPQEDSSAAIATAREGEGAGSTDVRRMRLDGPEEARMQEIMGPMRAELGYE